MPQPSASAAAMPGNFPARPRISRIWRIFTWKKRVSAPVSSSAGGSSAAFAISPGSWEQPSAPPFTPAPSNPLHLTLLIIRIIGWICGILNPQYVVLGGPDLRKDCIGPISDGFSALLPRHMSAEILYSADLWHDYHDGMAYLTAGKIFDDVQFIKEQP